ncbi:hypothetical protein HYT05_02135 [Candidatus Kaiserbacteria bacterium]|nr:hypothetical protein [Candidatus Kaiserbacteria bacterium]
MLAFMIVAIGYGLFAVVLAVIAIIEVALIFGPTFTLALQVRSINQDIWELKLVRQVRYPEDIGSQIRALQNRRLWVIPCWFVVASVGWYLAFVPYRHFLESLNWSVFF